MQLAQSYHYMIRDHPSDAKQTKTAAKKEPSIQVDFPYTFVD